MNMFRDLDDIKGNALVRFRVDIATAKTIIGTKYAVQDLLQYDLLINSLELEEPSPVRAHPPTFIEKPARIWYLEPPGINEEVINILKEHADTDEILFNLYSYSADFLTFIGPEGVKTYYFQSRVDKAKVKAEDRCHKLELKLNKVPRLIQFLCGIRYGE